ncbi:hypothetical protein [Acrocarpospora sp. B8E8]|uniref:hypothetical protein n=1 Tax=Acrocarpospora sp. B8E8 TaxID=3153572 RepID=UPI00325EDB0B
MRSVTLPGLGTHTLDQTLRRLIVAWQHPTSRLISAVGALEQHDDGYAFSYLRLAEQVEDFRAFIGFPDLYRRYESTQLFPLFRQRVMDPKRPDYIRYLETLGLGEDAAPMEILGRSSGVRPGDAILLFPEPTVDPSGSTHCTFLVHGMRHMAKFGVLSRLSTLRPGDQLRLKPDPTNPVNNQALIITSTDDHPLGWVPDVLLSYVHTVLATSPLTLTVERANTASVPWHLRLCVKLTGQVSPGYRPFNGPDWQPLSG